jgi:hypothetical protein
MLVTVSVQCGTLWCGMFYSNAYFCITTMRNTDLLEIEVENVNVNFVMKEFPEDKQLTVW